MKANIRQPIILTKQISIGITLFCKEEYSSDSNKSIDLLTSLGKERLDYRWCPLSVETKAAMEALQRCNTQVVIYNESALGCEVNRTTHSTSSQITSSESLQSLLINQGYFLIPAHDLQSPLLWWDWRRRMLAFIWFSDLPLTTTQELYVAWYRLKFLCQELDNPWARAMGRTLAALQKSEFLAFEPIFRSEVLSLLRKPSTTAKITNSLWKHYAHYRKSRGKIVMEIQSPDFKREVFQIAKELLIMESTSIDDTYLFGASPVLYRPNYKEELAVRSVIVKASIL